MTFDPAAQSSSLPVSQRRPSGVVGAAVALALASLGLLFAAALCGLAAVFMGKAPQVASQMAAAQASSGHGGAVPPSLAMLVAVYVLMAMASLALAVWGGVTVAGLLRLKPWARVSIMIQGGLLAAAGGFWATGSLMAPMMMRSMQLPPNVSAAQLRMIFVLFALAGAAVALVGVWWIVYFALKSTGAAFRPLAAGPAPIAVPRPPSRPELITDFTVAQPLPPNEVREAPPATEGNEPRP